MKPLFLIAIFLYSFSSFGQVLQQQTDFGKNEGELDMYFYKPDGLAKDAALVVALHGCSQTAESYAYESGWNELADQYKFMVIYPQQRKSNNAYACFNWFNEGDINPKQGENQSILEMIEYAKANYSVDKEKVFVTGFSAGGAMSTILLGNYPKVFEGGGVLAGIAYKAATNLPNALQVMKEAPNLSNEALSALLPSSTLEQKIPKLAVFTGAKDQIVTPKNSQQIISQFLFASLASAPELTPQIDTLNVRDTKFPYQRINYKVGDQQQFVSFTFLNEGHALFIDEGSEKMQGGHVGNFTKDVDFHSSYWIADFWGLID
ncbi:extracellular catalytic domain type 1 short-chain-length polyhydroxyalkanoate depolymerase [Sediminitomix flava]|uniref:Poly(Hydroxyalkanoate) depolymerase family esterase n=1 Tax=Sediminitomix flava TaxID=379075 RepID=A0A315ZGU1_SEDFL|nr:PHB depolymerase family esterase [Sediminitomix flava]PWJ44731.1 poly(hydroxyalkanoate) depolymerase family esterase [Sediminitomix flava]